MSVILEISQNLKSNQLNAARVLHGRGRYFEGYEKLNIEWYPPYLFVQNFSDTLNDQQEADLSEIFDTHEFIDAVLVQKREFPDFKTEVLFSRKNVELPLEQWTTLAEEIKCETKLGKNRNTGVFLDMRAGWDWIKANSKERTVLNLFSYTGVFSLFALKGGATKVDNVDMAANVLKIAQRNHQQNNVHDGKAAFYKRNILKSDRWFESRQPYDIIITDPPPYQKKGFHGWTDYQKLLKQCKDSLAEDGILFTCLNNPQVTIDEFKTSLEQAFPEAKLLEVIPTAPEIKEQDQRKGLKTIAIYF